jgi:hypothetical protein
MVLDAASSSSREKMMEIYEKIRISMMSLFFPSILLHRHSFATAAAAAVASIKSRYCVDMAAAAAALSCSQY